MLRSHKFWFGAPLLILTFFLLSLSIKATTFIMTSEEEKMKESEWICAVKVLSLKTNKTKEAERLKPNNQEPTMTIATVQPIECFKGGTTKSFEVTWPGGLNELAQEYTHVPGVPQLQPGQAAILYLTRNSPNETFTVHSWTNGVLNLQPAEKEGEYLIQNHASTPEPKTQHPRNPKSSKNSKAKMDVASGTQSLKSFREKVQKVLGSEKR